MYVFSFKTYTYADLKKLFRFSLFDSFVYSLGYMLLLPNLHARAYQSYISPESVIELFEGFTPFVSVSYL